MRILGIDPGTRALGYGVIDASGSAVVGVAWGTFEVGPIDHAERLRALHGEIVRVIEAHRPAELAIEMPVMGRNPQSALKLGRAQGAAMVAAARLDLPVTQYTPAEVKKAVVGNGQAAKEQVAYMVAAQLGVALDAGHDASDALAVAICHAHRVEVGAGGRFKDWESFVRGHPGRIRRL
ncbi:MAG: crossover junction endodeoxyribonuclease RuvC [Rubricoccaceae bacterium]|nr:crossover junction endodeoxyribonuclease RuvC [Rubricoccaceae bacterium]